MLKARYYSKSDNVKNYFSCYGSFGDIKGDVTRGDGSIELSCEDYSLRSEFCESECGVYSRRDSFTNKTDRTMTVNRFQSRFVFEGGEYEVYTQFNTWQNESMGAWQTLNTVISSRGGSTRTTQDATPFIAIWNKQASRGFAFHLLPESTWEMRVSRIGIEGKCTKILVEIGFSDYNFAYELPAGETLRASEMLCYEITDKLSMNCEKLHAYMHERAPRREMPIIYNSWMSRFDDISYEKLAPQVMRAAEIGCEYFVIDAGWFGDGKAWSVSVGDWVENRSGAMCGRMKELADLVRDQGMRFGLWLEPQRAMPTSKAVVEHPEFYIPGDAEPEFFFLNFARDDAREWIFGVICGLIDEYGISFIKEDYNADLCFDERHGDFADYHAGYRKYIKALKDRYPDLYISCCASGGERSELSNYMLFDSFWQSDNENPRTQLRIFKDTILRLPSQGIERCVAIHSSLSNEEIYAPFASYSGGDSERIIACGDGTWTNLVSVRQAMLEGFMSGGPICFSCDLTKISDKTFERIKNFVSGIKADRDFWMKASVRLLADTESVTVIEYSDSSFDRVEVHFFTKETRQNCFYAYPAVDVTADYMMDGERVSGREIAAFGVSKSLGVWTDNWHDVHTVKLTKCK